MNIAPELVTSATIVATTYTALLTATATQAATMLSRRRCSTQAVVSAAS
jgi:hypothetical protein